jgi:flagellar biosynthesis/type III secretory pathway M-ring protein FliF/YscJ
LFYNVVLSKIKTNMAQLTQNKKIALTALAIFMVSFAFMMFFLEENVLNSDSHGVNVLESVEQGHGSEEAKTVEPVKDIAPEEAEVEKKGTDWMERIYPKIKDLENDSSGRLMVDKII